MTFHTRKLAIRTALAIAALVAAAPAFAHKVNLFTYVEDNVIYLQGYFADGNMAQNSQVTVTDPSGNVLAQGTTSDAGEYSLPVPAREDLTIVIDAGLGHRTEYTLSKHELAGGDGSSTAPVAAGENGEPGQDGAPQSGPASTDQLQQLVRQAVAEAVKPLARELADYRSKATISEIIGGIGYIVGVLGLVAYLQARRKTDPGGS